MYIQDPLTLMVALNDVQPHIWLLLFLSHKVVTMYVEELKFSDNTSSAIYQLEDPIFVCNLRVCQQ